ncbi:c-type cytochrome [bacterium]|jgi:ssDNA-binding Zn-finger/Zn-ribbon topoisomerase 1|nr:c-type cytochrome [bacterium]
MKLLSLFFILFTAGLFAGEDSQVAQQSERKKRLKFYGDLSKKELKTRMKYIAKSLGVKCKFCHLKDKKLSLGPDIKAPSHRKVLRRKEIARNMIEMVETINSKFLKWEHGSGREADQIDCHFCHRGSADHLLEKVPIPGKK